MDTESSDPKTPPDADAPLTWRERYTRLKDRFKQLTDEYGTIAIVTWLAIFGLTLGGFVLAVKAGYQPESGAGETGVVVIAYAATQATKPLRLIATLALTPLIARFLRRAPTSPPIQQSPPPQNEHPQTH